MRSGLKPAHSLFRLYIIAIILGSIMLSLPQATNCGNGAPLLVALFTAVSATCVTGLVVVNTGQYWSGFGQMVILLLIQLGGLGLMTATTIASIMLGRRVSYRGRMILSRERSTQTAGIIKLVRYILFLTLTIQGLGLLILLLVWQGRYPLGRALYLALFHAVSAFNNAGFDLFEHSLQAFNDHYLLNLTMAGLIILGGLGFTVLQEVLGRRKQNFSLHSRLVFTATLLLLVIGFAVFYAFEFNNTDIFAGLSPGTKILVAFFQSVTARTAGFSTVDLARLQDVTLFFFILLMFIGASPASTGGGVKTTTAGTLFLFVHTQLKGERETGAFFRRLTAETSFQAMALFLLALTLVFAATAILALVEEIPFLFLLFEVTSAFGTVGLSTGITSALSPLSLLVLIMVMFLGRLGPLNLIVFFTEREERRGKISYPEEDIIIG